jgi:anthranilate synthase/aminodeoxychorismate synthase-like glutamine amidotransferase
MTSRVLIVDNYDSFTYNLAQGFGMLGAVVTVRRNDEIDSSGAADLAPTHLVISPGPGTPERAGASMSIIEALLPTVPVLGVCLGHQALAATLGATVGPAQRLVHGKASPIYHDSRTLYEGMPNPFHAGRYHSLGVVEESLPDVLSVSAYTSDGEIMGVRHQSLSAEGVQFHPESVLTPEGQRLLRNFLDFGL